MKILIADDDAISRCLVQKTLEREGYEVLVVENGSSAAECLSSDEGPRLALLDWVMPELDGLSVCRQIRGRSNHPYVYMILLTSKESKEDMVRGFEAGADDYLTKPCDPKELKARLRAGQRILKLQDKLIQEARQDPLTRLPNRTFFLDQLARRVTRAKRRPDYIFAVLFVDIDGFKIVNDSLGHFAGDQLIVQIAERLVSSVRREDLVSCLADVKGPVHQSGEDTLARMGGDEFTILLDDIRNASDGIRVAERIRQILASPFLISGQKVSITASIGIAISATGYSTAEDILRDADTAMYRAKALGKSRYEICDPAMHARAMSRLKLETDLRRALDRDEFRIHYQPIVSLRDCRIIGFEALLRWQRPDFGLVMPGEFIPVAEETGQIQFIGLWVLREACRQMRAWTLQFPSDPPFTVAVNISAKQFAQPDLVSEVGDILRETCLDSRCLKLELTESVTMREVERAVRIFGELKRLGVRLCMDDFGTGYSSLSQLRRLPLDILKIDRSFVSEMEDSSESYAIVQTILSLGRSLGMEMVAEGVESANQVGLLKSLGCEYAQGYFFSKPIDQDGMVEVLLKSSGSAYRLPQQSVLHQSVIRR
jgi:predicted signal transduction protein with EAL and GGDEF domain